MIRRFALLLVLPISAWASVTQATVTNYFATLSGAAESPANGSPGTGTATFSYDDVTHMFSINTSFSGLQGTTTASHIHAAAVFSNPGINGGTAGVATTTPTFAGFPLGVTSGSYSNILDLTQAGSWNPSFITNNGGTTASAEAAFISFVNTGRSYLNIHTSSVGSGEIRGFLVTVPEPTSCLLASLGLTSLGFSARRRRD